jgi:hypothetical protein
MGAARGDEVSAEYRVVATPVDVILAKAAVDPVPASVSVEIVGTTIIGSCET